MNPDVLNKVLIVDDDVAILRILKAHLEAEGYVVCTAFSGPQAIDLVRKERPSYLITDWDMPGMDGLELCRQVRQLELEHYVYIVFLTGRSNEGDLVAAMHAGADNFLNKPVRRVELLARLTAGARVLSLESRLSQLAAHDSLSGLLLRGPFAAALHKEWCHARRFHLPLSAVMLDIDFFKQVNDVHGHPAGDAAIRHISELIRQHARGQDVAARYGGEEFCILMPDTDEPTATAWAEELRCRLADSPITIDGKPVHITASLGVAEMLADMEDKDELLSLTDQCLLLAKRQGRNRVVSLADLSHDSQADRSALPDSRFADVLAQDVMMPLVHFLRSEWSIVRAVSYFLRYRVASAPVTDSEGNLLGIVSEKDVLAICHSEDAPQRRVIDVMRTKVIAYDHDAPIVHILQFLTRASLRSVIVTEQGKPCGLISRASLIRWILDHHWNAEHRPSWDRRLVETTREEGEALRTVARELAATAEELREFFDTPQDMTDAAPLVGGVSRMQELLQELLAGSASKYVTGGGLPY